MKHIHHIIPKHMDGTDDPSNLFECSVEEHAELHLALYLEHGHWEDYIAALSLGGIMDREELVAIKLSESGKKGGARGKGKTAWNKGKKMWSEEDRERMSRERRGRKCNISEESREKMREAARKNKGRKRPDLAERNKQRKGLNIARDENGRFV